MSRLQRRLTHRSLDNAMKVNFTQKSELKLFFLDEGRKDQKQQREEIKNCLGIAAVEPPQIHLEVKTHLCTKTRMFAWRPAAATTPHLHMSVWCTDGRKWKTWLLTARLCSSLKGSRTTPSLTGKVSRSSSLWLAARVEREHHQSAAAAATSLINH